MYYNVITTIPLTNPFIKSHNYHFFSWWEQFRSRFLAALKFINSTVLSVIAVLCIRLIPEF